MLGLGHPPGYLGLAIVPSGLFGLGTERWATLQVIWAWLLYCTLRVIWAGHPLGCFSAEPPTRPPPGYLGLAIVPSGLFGLGTLWVISLLVMTYASVMRRCCCAAWAGRPGYGTLRVIFQPGHPPGYLGLAIVPSGLFGLGTEHRATLRVIWAWLFYCTLRVIWAGHPPGYFSAEPSTMPPDQPGYGTLRVIFQPGHPPGYLGLAIVPPGYLG